MLLGLLLSGCASAPLREATQAESEVAAYYQEVARVFERQDAQALAELYDPEITQPMTRQAILEWGVKFFTENSGVRIHIDRLSFEEVSPDRAAVIVDYRVTTAGTKADFGGTERDRLIKRDGRWLVASWEKLVPKP